MTFKNWPCQVALKLKVGFKRKSKRNEHQQKLTMSWDRIIRFGVDGKVAFAEPIITADEVFSVQELAKKGQLRAKYFEGADIFSLIATDKVVEVKSLLPCLTADDVPIIKCVGLNYMKHSEFSMSYNIYITEPSLT